MSTRTKTLLAVIAVLLPLVVAGTASAGKPPRPDRGGYTCAYDGFDQSSHGLEFTATGFSFTLTGHQDDMCVDVPYELADTTGEWWVSVTDVSGSVRRLLLIPRDSVSPGDSCGGWNLRNPDLPAEFAMPLPIPPATVNACGTDFGEWLDTNGDGNPDTLEMTQTGAEDPLVFIAFLEGHDPEVTITVTVP